MAPLKRPTAHLKRALSATLLMLALFWGAPLHAQPAMSAPPEDAAEAAAEADPTLSAITLSQRIARVAALEALEALRLSKLQALGLQAARAAGGVEALRASTTPGARRAHARAAQSIALARASARAARADALVEAARAAGALADAQRARLIDDIAKQRDRHLRAAERRAEAKRDDVIARQRLAQTNQLRELLNDQLQLADQVLALTRRLPERQ